jgi:hypothetical protein
MNKYILMLYGETNMLKKSFMAVFIAISLAVVPAIHAELEQQVIVQKDSIGKQERFLEQLRTAPKETRDAVEQLLATQAADLKFNADLHEAFACMGAFALGCSITALLAGQDTRFIAYLLIAGLVTYGS